MKEYRNPSNVHPPIGGYTHQVEVKGPERLLIISGQVGKREDGVVPDDPYEQLEIALENLFRNLQAGNMDVQDILKINFYLVGEMDAAKRREVVAAKLKGHKPCMTLVYVSALASSIYKVEIEAWASSTR
jgi:2-iminobutanoate/2-iminopropanoate deaminase